jgi:anti-sigma-K factor RskA
MSKSREDHSSWQELVAGYALHALDEADETRLLDHLGECAECRAELDAHALTASHLASLADDPDTAPPSWAAIRDAVIGDQPATVTSLSDRRQQVSPVGRWLLAAAAVVVILAGATLASRQVLGSSDGSGAKDLAVAQCDVTRGCAEVDLRSSDGSRRAAVVVIGGVARVQPISLHAPRSGRTFVLWQLPRSGAPIALGAFSSTDQLSDTSKLAVSMAQTTGFAVSSEPSGVAPTKPTVVLALGGVTT